VCFTLRDGTDVTLVSWGASIHETLQAADRLAEESGISCEVIDLATIKPLDMDSILESVERTGRCVIVHEAARTCGVGAEIAAEIAEKGLLNLFAPVRRVAGYDTIMPLLKLEQHYLPGVDRICRAVRETMEFA
jgi:pyruvate dehydrogenase E1 component beta subunit